MSFPEICKSTRFRIGGTSSTECNLWQRGRVLWQRLVEAGKRTPRNLRLCESLSLGERRFVAVIAYRQSRFLLGGTSGSLVLLANLGNELENDIQPVSLQESPQ
jgi:flagellar biogenesis protein FliO